MPLMCGPGVIATVVSMMATVKKSDDIVISFFTIVAAILVAVLFTYLCLYFAASLLKHLGKTGIDAITRIVGFFVAAIGVQLVVSGILRIRKS